MEEVKFELAANEAISQIEKQLAKFTEFYGNSLALSDAVTLTFMRPTPGGEPVEETTDFVDTQAVPEFAKDAAEPVNVENPVEHDATGTTQDGVPVSYGSPKDQLA